MKQFDNPPPGTVVDHTITRRGLFDFYLVSQKMRHGTATPSHYVVIENEANLPPDTLQQLSYKLTYQYFNWPGSIRVPAPCQVSKQFYGCCPIRWHLSILVFHSTLINWPIWLANPLNEKQLKCLAINYFTCESFETIRIKFVYISTVWNYKSQTENMLPVMKHLFWLDINFLFLLGETFYRFSE